MKKMQETIKRWQQRILQCISSWRKKKSIAAQETPPQATEKTDAANDYFQQATSWADDIYTHAIASRYRYQLAFYGMIVLSILLALCVAQLVPAQKIEPLLIHHYDGGYVSVEPMTELASPLNRAQVESDLVRYIVSRESYSATAYNKLYELVSAMSNKTIMRRYNEEQSTHNEQSVINRLGNDGIRSVRVESIVFLDNVSLTPERVRHPTDVHHNLAQINFTLTDEHTKNNTRASLPLTALISWEYRGPPRSPEARWRNWNGFTVTHYQIQQRNV